MPDIRTRDEQIGDLREHFDPVDLVEWLVDARREAVRYRLAWLSARRRAADEASMALEALALRDEEIRRLRAALDEQRQTTSAPHLAYAGEDEDGEVWHLVLDGTPPREIPWSHTSQITASAP